jgi:hypothetical protein
VVLKKQKRGENKKKYIYILRGNGPFTVKAAALDVYY